MIKWNKNEFQQGIGNISDGGGSGGRGDRWATRRLQVQELKNGLGAGIQSSRKKLIDLYGLLEIAIILNEKYSSGPKNEGLIFVLFFEIEKMKMKAFLCGTGLD